MTPLVALLATGLAPAILLAGMPNPQTVQAFDNYIKNAETRIRSSEHSTSFLWSDGTPVRQKHVRDGEVVTEPWTGKGDVEVSGGLIHDWIGAVFISGATLRQALDLVQDYNRHKDIYKPEVVESHLNARDGNDFRISYRLLKKKVITVILNTDHEVRYTPIDQTRWSSRSYSTRIAEVASAGAPGEHELPPAEDRGFLWRLNSYWRFEERDGGVYVECEAISLTRGVPGGLGWLINPIVRTLPAESLANTLKATRDALRQR